MSSGHRPDHDRLLGSRYSWSHEDFGSFTQMVAKRKVYRLLPGSQFGPGYICSCRKRLQRLLGSRLYPRVPAVNQTVFATGLCAGSLTLPVPVMAFGDRTLGLSGSWEWGPHMN